MMFSQIYSLLLTEMQQNVVTAIVVLTGQNTINYLVNYNLSYIDCDFVQTGTDDVTFIKLSSSAHDAAMSQISTDFISYIQGGREAIVEFAVNPDNGIVEL